MLISVVYHTICKTYLLGICDLPSFIRSCISVRNLGLFGKSWMLSNKSIHRAYAIRSLLSGECHMTSLILQAKCTNALLSVQVDFNQMVISLKLLLIKLKCISLQNCVSLSIMW